MQKNPEPSIRMVKITTSEGNMRKMGTQGWVDWAAEEIRLLREENKDLKEKSVDQEKSVDTILSNIETELMDKFPLIEDWDIDTIIGIVNEELSFMDEEE